MLLCLHKKLVEFDFHCIFYGDLFFLSKNAVSILVETQFQKEMRANVLLFVFCPPMFTPIFPDKSLCLFNWYFGNVRLLQDKCGIA